MTTREADNGDLPRPDIESQAKAGVEGRPHGSGLPESVSRLAGGRTPAATSEKMDATGRRDAHPDLTLCPERPFDGPWGEEKDTWNVETSGAPGSRR